MLIIVPKNFKASDYIVEYKDRDGKAMYVTTVELRYYSYRYSNWVVCAKYFTSDGATGAYDIDSFGWLFHDELCNTGTFHDNVKCTNWQASQVVSDILRNEKRYFRSITWKYATFLFGGGEARVNGMFKL